MGLSACSTFQNWGDEIAEEDRGETYRSDRVPSRAVDDEREMSSYRARNPEERARMAQTSTGKSRILKREETPEGESSWDAVETGRSGMDRRRTYPQVESAKEIFAGMPMNAVRSSWGLPDRVQTAGDVGAQGRVYERWVYFPTLYEPTTRIVYFEGGRVSAWERR